ncbi:MAG: dTDP-4-dehydrorhamnose reductase [Bernardetiaceae bacterium]
MPKKILVIGSHGQLGQALAAVAPGWTQWDWLWADRSQIDLTQPQSIANYWAQYRPDWCINAAAYTNVDRAQQEPQAAFAVNALGAGHLAAVAEQYGSALIHLSTDFVFGHGHNRPIDEGQPISPLSVYGASKAAGELAVRDALSRHLIVRTSWLYSAFGNNFFKTILRLSRTQPELRVVMDQVGTPTYALDLAADLCRIIDCSPTDSDWGTYHYSQEGTASWYDFAQAIIRADGSGVPVLPVGTEAFPRPAPRPSYSVLDKGKIKAHFGLRLRHWQEPIVELLREG